MNVLDTSVLIEIANDTEKGQEMADKLNGEETAITTVSYYEFYRSGEKSRAEEFLKKFTLLTFDEESAEQTGEVYRLLKKKGQMINELDMLIAGICQSNDATLYTLDKDFEKIASLKKVIL